jgi:hypothetical protein
MAQVLIAGGAPEPLTSGRWLMRVDQAAERWQDALVTGNGRHGTMVMGSPSHERITNVHEELFLRNWDRSITGVPDRRTLVTWSSPATPPPATGPPWSMTSVIKSYRHHSPRARPSDG